MALSYLISQRAKALVMRDHPVLHQTTVALLADQRTVVGIRLVRIGLLSLRRMGDGEGRVLLVQ